MALVDLGGIGPPPLGCKPSALPLCYRPVKIKYKNLVRGVNPSSRAFGSLRGIADCTTAMLMALIDYFIKIPAFRDVYAHVWVIIEFRFCNWFIEPPGSLLKSHRTDNMHIANPNNFHQV